MSASSPASSARARIVCAAIVATATFLLPADGRAQLRSVLVATGLPRPIFAASPSGDTRLFIVQQRGRISVLKNGSVLPTPFLDIQSRVLSGGLRGMLGLAFHPGYALNGRFYVYFTDLQGDSQIEEYTVSGNPDVADPGSLRPILTVDQPVGFHNGGSLAFSPFDGFLYIGMGDGGPDGDPSGNAQNPAVLLGKVLRIDVDTGIAYAIPADNPFVGVAGYREEIWALGVRNPWGVGFDSETGDFWMAEVGASAWEEIDFLPAATPGGQNYGWKFMEGTHCFDPPINCNDGSLTLPIFEYSHLGGHCAISGGAIYRGAVMSFLGGAYFFGDYCSTKIWSVRYDGSTAYDLRDWTADLEPAGAPVLDEIVGLCAGPGGEIYIIDRGPGDTDGEIYRIDLDPLSVGPGGSEAGWRLDPLFPNPSAGPMRGRLTIAGPSRIEVDVIDVGGRWVRRLLSGEYPAGGVSFTWDGMGADGLPAASGIYFVRARGGDGSSSRRATLLR